MSKGNVEVVKGAVAAVNERDIDRYLAGCTEDIELTTRASGIPAAAGIATTNVYDLVDGKIRRVRIFFDRQEALEAAGLSE